MGGADGICVHAQEGVSSSSSVVSSFASQDHRNETTEEAHNQINSDMTVDAPQNGVTQASSLQLFHSYFSKEFSKRAERVATAWTGSSHFGRDMNVGRQMFVSKTSVLQ